jgi:hypothetical protein
MSTDTLTLKNTAGTISATIRYPMGSSGMPEYMKSFTKHQLSDGSFAYDMPTTATKRVWNIMIDGEDAGDALLATFKSLFALQTSLHLDVDIDTYGINESNIDVMFEQFRAMPIVADVFQYQIVLQEL